MIFLCLILRFLPSVLLFLLKKNKINKISIKNFVDFLPSKSQRSDNSLNLGSLLPLLFCFTGELSSNDIFLNQGNVILFLQSKQFLNLIDSLWSQSSWFLSISQPGNILFSLLNNCQSKYTYIGANNAAPNALSLPLSSFSWPVIFSSLGK